MTKRTCYFHFSGERQFRQEETRHWVAHMLWSCRANPNAYRVTRWEKGYMVKASNNPVVAIIETR